MKLISSIVKFVGVSVVCGAAMIASAQSPVRLGGINTSLLEAGTGLLMFPQVHRELGLSQNVSNSITSDYKSVMQKMMFRAPGGSSAAKPSGPDIGKQMEEMRQVQSRALAKLSPPQKARLKQLALQQMGPAGLSHPEVKSALKLTPAQSTKIDTIVRQGTMDMMSGMNFGASKGQPDPKDMQNRMTAMQKKREVAQAAMSVKVMKELTPAQKTKWNAMVGKPFKLDIMGGIRNMMGGASKKTQSRIN